MTNVGTSKPKAQAQSAKALSVISKGETHAKKKEMKKIYDDVDETFLAGDKPKDPFEIVDRRTQKIDINPGVPYKSTSHDEVFELRAKLVQERALAEKNKFL